MAKNLMRVNLSLSTRTLDILDTLASDMNLSRSGIVELLASGVTVTWGNKHPISTNTPLPTQAKEVPRKAPVKVQAPAEQPKYRLHDEEELLSGYEVWDSAEERYL